MVQRRMALITQIRSILLERGIVVPMGKYNLVRTYQRYCLLKAAASCLSYNGYLRSRAKRGGSSTTVSPTSKQSSLS